MRAFRSIGNALVKRYQSRSQVDNRIMARGSMVKFGDCVVTFSRETDAEHKRYPSPIGRRRYTVSMNFVCHAFTDDYSRALREFLKCVHAARRSAQAVQS